MFFHILLALCLGVFLGIFTGLIPGLHTNIAVSIILGLASIEQEDRTLLCVFIFAAAVTDAIVSIIPSVYIGAPEESTSLAVLPGHRFLLRGEAFSAVKIWCIGAAIGVIASMAAMPAAIILLKHLSAALNKYMLFILLAIIAIIFIRENKRLVALTVFIVSGIYGIASLKTGNNIFPMLTGLFGISNLLVSMKKTEGIPKQTRKKEEKIHYARPTISGLLAGLLVATLPGMSVTTTASLFAGKIKTLPEKGFLMTISITNSANIILSLAVVLAIDKARNGSTIVVQKLLPDIMEQLPMLLFSALAALGAGILITLAIPKIVERLLQKMSYKGISIAIILSLLSMTAIIGGMQGLAIAAIGTIIGMIPIIKNVSRTYCMGCILIPVIGYYI
jgi:putative membrane protein